MNLLEIRNLRTYLDTPAGLARAVDGVDLTITEGEAVGIVGESGSGKSILALSVLGLLPRRNGRIVDGSSVRLRGRELVGKEGRRHLASVRGREIAMVFQEPMTSLNPVFPVGSQILEGLRLHRGMTGPVARGEAVRLLREVGIGDAEGMMDRYPHQLSGGMRQRVMIAAALSGEPALLLADEPTTALDVTIQAQILGLLKELRTRRGMALLLISHDLRVVAGLCDTLYVMYGGRMVETGPAREIFLNPRHPYTRGLLGSRLSLKDRRGRLRPIPGEVPESTVWPGGCRFHPRCPHRAPVCNEEPELLAPESMGDQREDAGPSAKRSGTGDSRRMARCWFPEAGAWGGTGSGDHA
jgi:peptide/nickel transport system ATP-binding protein/oligopeptide transport system ATP-binding protein